MRWRTHLIAACLLTLAGVSGQAQTSFRTVDRKEVEQLVSDVSLRSFYPALLDRFNAFDSTLTPEDYRLIYYGFVFQPAYVWDADQRKGEMSRAMQASQYDLVVRMADSVLQINPISLAAHYFRAYAMMNINEKDSSYQKYIRRYSGLRDAILSSGDGLHCNTAFKTIFMEDEYEIMYNYFEVDSNLDPSVQYPCERFTVTPSGSYPHSEIFFDASEVLLASKKN